MGYTNKFIAENRGFSLKISLENVSKFPLYSWKFFTTIKEIFKSKSQYVDQYFTSYLHI